MVVVPPYLLDSNFFIQAYRFHYPLDVVPGFWLKVKELAEDGTIISIDKVQREIYQNKDDLTSWCKANLPDDFFKDSSVVLSAYTKIIGWASIRTPQFTSAALNEFLDADEADAWLAAYALENGNTIVTYETSETRRLNKVKLPDAASAHGVKCYTTIAMFRELKEVF